MAAVSSIHSIPSSEESSFPVPPIDPALFISAEEVSGGFLAVRSAQIGRISNLLSFTSSDLEALREWKGESPLEFPDGGSEKSWTVTFRPDGMDMVLNEEYASAVLHLPIGERNRLRQILLSKH